MPNTASLAKLFRLQVMCPCVIRFQHEDDSLESEDYEGILQASPSLRNYTQEQLYTRRDEDRDGVAVVTRRSIDRPAGLRGS